MIESLAQKSPARKEKTMIVMDAGIATEENLTKIKAKGYNYLCVSRTRLKEYTLREDHKCVIVQDSSKREIKLREVHTAPDEDYFLEITSPSKAMTEASMNRQWRHGKI